MSDGQKLVNTYITWFKVWLGDIKLFSAKNSCGLLYNILSNIFSATGSKDAGP